LRREGRRKRKAGAKNEKAIIIIAVFHKRSTKKFPQTDYENSVFIYKTLSKWL